MGLLSVLALMPSSPIARPGVPASCVGSEQAISHPLSMCRTNAQTGCAEDKDNAYLKDSTDAVVNGPICHGAATEEDELVRLPPSTEEALPRGGAAENVCERRFCDVDLATQRNSRPQRSRHRTSQPRFP